MPLRLNSNRRLRTKVLLVEDNPEMAEVIAGLLTRDFDVVGTLPDASVLETEIQRLGAQVVVLDIALPGINGIAATRQLKASRPDIRVVLMTSYGESLRRYGIEAGADGFVPKAAAGRLLADAVRSAAQAGSRESPLPAEVPVSGSELDRQMELDSRSTRASRIVPMRPAASTSQSGLSSAKISSPEVFARATG